MIELRIAKRFNWFKYTTISVVIFFISVIVFVVYTAQTRHYSGRTGLDASQMHEMRHQTNKQYCEKRMMEREVVQDTASP